MLILRYWIETLFTAESSLYFRVASYKGLDTVIHTSNYFSAVSTALNRTCATANWVNCIILSTILAELIEQYFLFFLDSKVVTLNRFCNVVYSNRNCSLLNGLNNMQKITIYRRFAAQVYLLDCVMRLTNFIALICIFAIPNCR